MKQSTALNGAVSKSAHASGDSLGSLGAGALGKVFSSSMSVLVLGVVSFGLGLVMLTTFGTLRAFSRDILAANGAMDESSTGEDSNARSSRKDYAAG